MVNERYFVLKMVTNSDGDKTETTLEVEGFTSAEMVGMLELTKHNILTGKMVKEEKGNEPAHDNTEA